MIPLLHAYSSIDDFNAIRRLMSRSQQSIRVSWRLRLHSGKLSFWAAQMYALDINMNH